MIFWSIVSLLIGAGLMYVGGAICFRGHTELIDGCEKKEVRAALGDKYARCVGLVDLLGGACCAAVGVCAMVAGLAWWAVLVLMAACILAVCAAVAVCRSMMLRKCGTAAAGE